MNPNNSINELNSNSINELTSNSINEPIHNSTMGIKILVIGDPHFKVSNVLETENMCSAIIQQCKKYTPHIIVVLGDVLDRHENIHVGPLNRAIKFLATLMNIAPTFVLIGNHDLKNNQQFLSDEHPFSSLKHWTPHDQGHDCIYDDVSKIPKMNIVDVPHRIDVCGNIFMFVPYVPCKRFIEALDHIPNWRDVSTKCIFAHQEFIGAKMGAIISTEGDEWELEYPFVVSGHIHDYQKIQDNILYIGTPIQHSYGDQQDKTISCFTFLRDGCIAGENIKQMDEYDVEYSKEYNYIHQRIDLKLPKKTIVRITCEQVSTYTPPKNCELKIIIRGNSGQIKSIIRHPNIDVWKQLNYKIVYKDTPHNNNNNIDSTINAVAAIPKRYSTILYDTISEQPPLKTLFHNLFGDIVNTNNN